MDRRQKTITIEPATVKDTQAILSIFIANKGDPGLFQESEAEIRRNLQDFIVARDANGKAVACSALHRDTAELAKSRGGSATLLLKCRRISPGSSNIVLMNLRTVVSLLLTGMILSATARAQDKPVPERADPLFFIKIAGDVAANVQQQSLDNFLGIYVDEQNWASGTKDSDLGPFLKLKEASAKTGRSAAFYFNEAKDTAICVYFDGKSPFGVVSVKASGGSIQASDVSTAYKPVSKDMLKKGNQEWHFSQTSVNADDGTPLPAFQITK